MLKKPAIVCLFLMFATSFYGCSQDFQKISPEEVGRNKIKIGKEFNDKLYGALKRGEIYDFSNEATEEVKRQITPELQKSIYKQVKDKFGDYVSSEYAEAWVQKNNTNYKILRYKGQFSESDTKLELRVVLDDTNKIAGFFIKPWSDMFN